MCRDWAFQMCLLDLFGAELKVFVWMAWMLMTCESHAATLTQEVNRAYNTPQLAKEDPANDLSCLFSSYTAQNNQDKAA